MTSSRCLKGSLAGAGPDSKRRRTFYYPLFIHSQASVLSIFLFSLGSDQEICLQYKLDVTQKVFSNA